MDLPRRLLADHLLRRRLHPCRIEECSGRRLGVKHWCKHTLTPTEKALLMFQPHYARTLREWRRRFLANFDNLIAPALRAEHSEMTDADIEVFKRKWICK